MSDYTEENEALKRLKEIKATKAGIACNATLMQEMSSVLQKEYYQAPRRVLDRVYEVIDNLASVGWDVQRQTTSHADLGKDYEMRLKSIPSETLHFA